MNIPEPQQPQLSPPEKPPLAIDSPAVLNYLTTLQGIITRLATNSSNCKTLCVTLVSAITVVITNKAKPEFAWVALIPIISLGFLDAYYLSLERTFRKTYHAFTAKLIADQSFKADLFQSIASNSHPVAKFLNLFKTIFNILYACTSYSIWLFYFPLALIVIFGKNLIFG